MLAKQIKVCAKYRDMVQKALAGLSGTPGFWSIGLRPGSWQIRIALGNYVQYSS